MISSDDRKHLLKGMTAEVAAAGVGLAVGGPVGALAAAGFTPVAHLILKQWTRSGENVVRLMDILSDLTNLSADELARWAHHDEGRRDLVAAAVQAAYTTRVEQKIEALARVLAENITDDAALEVAQLVVAALAQLEAPHIRVIHAMVRDSPPPLPVPGDSLTAALGTGQPERGAWCEYQLGEHLRGLAPGILPLAATLLACGILEEGLASEVGGRCWTVTPFGVECLNRVERTSAIES